MAATLIIDDNKVPLTEAMINRSEFLKSALSGGETVLELKIDYDLFRRVILPVLNGMNYFQALYDNSLHLEEKDGDQLESVKAYTLMKYFGFPRRGALFKPPCMITRLTSLYNGFEGKSIGEWCTDDIRDIIMQLHQPVELLTSVLLREPFKRDVIELRYHSPWLQNDDVFLNWKKTAKNIHWLFRGYNIPQLKIIYNDCCYRTLMMRGLLEKYIEKNLIYGSEYGYYDEKTHEFYSMQYEHTSKNKCEDLVHLVNNFEYAKKLAENHDMLFDMEKKLKYNVYEIKNGSFPIIHETMRIHNYSQKRTHNVPTITDMVLEWTSSGYYDQEHRLTFTLYGQKIRINLYNVIPENLTDCGIICKNGRVLFVNKSIDPFKRELNIEWDKLYLVEPEKIKSYCVLVDNGFVLNEK